MPYSSGMPGFVEKELLGGYERWGIHLLLPSNWSVSWRVDVIQCLGRWATLGYLCNQCFLSSKVMSVITSKAFVCAVSRSW